MKTETPLVTIAIPVYNHESFVADCIESVIDQTYDPIDLIIINDGSTDNSDLIITGLLPKAIARFHNVIYRSRGNLGLSATLNECLSLSQGDYFSCVASDDILTPDKIDFLMRHFSGTDDKVAGIFGNAGFIDRYGEPISLDGRGKISRNAGYKDFLSFYTRNRSPKVLTNNFGTYCAILEGNYLPAMSCVLRIDHVRSVGGWTDGNPLEDFDMWLKLAKNYKFILDNKIVAYYRWHGDNTVKKFTDKLVIWTSYIYNRERDYSFNTGVWMSWYKGYYYVFKNIFRIRSMTLPQKCNILHLRLTDLPFLSFFLFLDIFEKVKNLQVFQKRVSGKRV